MAADQETILAKLEALGEQFASLNALRRAISPQIIWVEEKELAQYIPYTVREIKKMRKENKLRFYPDIRGGNRIIYNLIEVSNKIQGSKGKALVPFDPDSPQIVL